jgi:hypothetical protein
MITGWALCVLLTVSLKQRDCISVWRFEADCWSEGADWFERAQAWRDRSHLGHIPIVFVCEPRFERVQTDRSNAPDKEVTR